MFRRFNANWKKATSSDQDRKEEILEAAEILIKYQGYIDRERMIAEKLARLESIKIKGKFDYSTIQSLSTEARQKLVKIDPETIAQASRIQESLLATSTCCWCFRDDKRQRFT